MRSQLHRLIVVVLSCFTATAAAHEPAMIASGNSTDAPKQPQATVDASGNVHVIFGVGNTVYHCVSTGSKQPFTAAEPAFLVPNMSLGMRRGPRIVAVKDTLIVTAIGGDMGMGRDGDVMSWTSMDHGKTWSGPSQVNDVTASAREGLHAMTSTPNGSVWCVWLDLRSKKTEIYASRSSDCGKTWGSNIRVYQSPDGSVCECCHPSVLATNDKLHIMFRNSLDGNRDVYLTTSEDEGKSFSPALKLGQGNWKFDACPMDGGMLAESGGNLRTVWRRQEHVYYVPEVEGPEVQLGRGQQPWIACNKSGSYIAWTTDRDGDLMLLRPGSEKATIIAKKTRDPFLVTSTDNTQVYCCWEAKHADKMAVFVQRVDTADSN